MITAAAPTDLQYPCEISAQSVSGVCLLLPFSCMVLPYGNNYFISSFNRQYQKNYLLLFMLFVLLIYKKGAFIFIWSSCQATEPGNSGCTSSFQQMTSLTPEDGQNALFTIYTKFSGI